MAAYKYVETHERYYPALGLTARPGDVHDFDGKAPDDGRWKQVRTAAERPARAPRRRKAEPQKKTPDTASKE